MSRLEGRVAVITGAASGIGAGMVRRWLEEGACVVGCDIKDSMPIEHERAVYVKGDLSRYEDAKNVIDTAVKTFGKIDSMVNCAGIALLGGLEDLSVEDMQKEFAVNVFGMFHICKAAIPYLKEQKGATLVNIASDCAFKTMKGWIGYGPSKAAVIQLSRCIAMEYAPDVRCNIICPGITETPMITCRFETAEDPAALRASYENQYPMKRIAQVSDMENAALFLSTEESSFITGETICVSGGSQME